MKPDSKIKDVPSSDAQNNLNVAVRYLSYLNPLVLHKRGTRAKAVFALVLVCILWGSTWLGSKEAVKYMHPLQMAGMRQFLGGLCYVLFFMIRGTTWPTKKEWPAILVLSFLNFILSNGLSTWGLRYISAGLGAIIGAIFPLWLVVISFVTKTSSPSWKSVMGLFLGFAGICVIFYDYLQDFFNPDFLTGILLSLVSTWSWAYGTLYTKKHAAKFNPYFGLGLQMTISGATLFTVSHLSGNAIPLSEVAWQAWAAIGYLVLFGSVIAFIAYLYALQNLPTEQASLYAYINPIVAVLLGWMIFSEKLTVYIIVGTLVTLTGVYLVNRASAKKPLQTV